MAKCVSGATDQSDITDLDFTLDEDEQKEGLTLLCMAYPVGDVAIETQSDWGMRVGEWKGATGGDFRTRTDEVDGRRSE